MKERKKPVVIDFFAARRNKIHQKTWAVRKAHAALAVDELALRISSLEKLLDSDLTPETRKQVESEFGRMAYLSESVKKNAAFFGIKVEEHPDAVLKARVAAKSKSLQDARENYQGVSRLDKAFEHAEMVFQNVPLGSKVTLHLSDGSVVAGKWRKLNFRKETVTLEVGPLWRRKTIVIPLFQILPNKAAEIVSL